MAFAHAAIADVTYKCVTKSGRVVYTDIALDQSCKTLGQTPTQSHQTRSRDATSEVSDRAAYDEMTARRIRNYRATKAAEARAEQLAIQQQELIDRENSRREQEEKRRDALQKEVRRLSEQGRAGRNKARVLLGMDQEEDNQPPPPPNINTPPMPSTITKCNEWGCTDSTGNYYSGNPEFKNFSSSDGRPCHSQGGVMYCN